MIHPKDLRIGNIVEKDGQWFITDFITIGMSRNYSPIPLTPELLVMAGFKKDRNNMWYKGDIRIEYRNNYCIFGFSDWGSTIIDYLHQLQNLYFVLIGEDLPLQMEETIQHPTSEKH